MAAEMNKVIEQQKTPQDMGQKELHASQAYPQVSEPVMINASRDL